MKQNERLLVYAVTGFLAVILLVAVVFGPSSREVSGAVKEGTTSPGLSEILGQKAPEGAPTGEANGVAGLPTPGQVTSEQPLVAGDRTLLAADLVTQQLGPNKRDRTVRLVRARAGDSLDTLVRRWCGARDPFLEEAKSLNEDLVTLRVGQEVCVPWVDDETVLAAIEASKPKTLVSDTIGDPLGSGNAPANAPATTAFTPRPNFAEPGGTRSPGSSSPGSSEASPSNVPAAATKSYTVKDGDSLWKIADRTYGRKNAARMVNEIRQANPGIDDRLRPGQKLVLPQAPEGGA